MQWLLAGIVLLGLLLRAPRLLESLWYDEITAWRQYGAHGPGVIVSSYIDPSNHVLHTLATWASVEALGGLLGAELALRLPALLASLGSIVAIFALVVRAAGVRAALIAAACAAVLPVPVLEGAEARGYSMMICFAALMSWSAMWAWESGGRWRWVVYAALCGLGIWSHPLTMAVPAGHAVCFLWALRKRQDRAAATGGLLALVLGAALTLGLYAPLLGQMLGLRGMLSATGAAQPRLLGVEGAHVIWQSGGSWFWWASLPGLTLVVAGAIAATGSPRLRRAAALTWTGLAVYAAGSLVAGHWSYARFALFAWPGAALLMAVGLDAIWRRRRVAAAVLAALLLAGAAADLAVRPPKQPLRDAADYVLSEAGPGERVLVVGLAHRVLDVYAADLDLTYSLLHGRDFDARLAESRPAWIVLYYPRSVPDDVYRRIDDAGCTLVRRFRGWVDWDNGDVLVYRRQ